MNIAIAYLLTLLVFAVIDTAWLGSMGDRLYRPLIGSMLAENFRLAPAIAFYALYAAGLTIFAVLPGALKRFSPPYPYLRPAFRFCQAICRRAPGSHENQRIKSVSLV